MLQPITPTLLLIEYETKKQFEINDNRSPTHMANVVKQAGLEVVWKDWEKCYSN